MQNYLLGKSGLRVSELALGAMSFGTEWGWGIELNEARKMLDLYIDSGGNFVDTANFYTNGSSERMLGELLGEKRHQVVLSTKYTMNTHPGDPNGGGNHRKSMIRSVETSLQRLKTDYIDLLYLHIWDGTTPVEEILRTMDDLVRAGKVLYVGISDTPAWQISRMPLKASSRRISSTNLSACGIAAPIFFQEVVGLIQGPSLPISLPASSGPHVPGSYL